MLVVVPPAHTNILLATATQCCLFSFELQPWLLLLLLAWLLRTPDPPLNMCPPQFLVFLLLGMSSFTRSTCGTGMRLSICFFGLCPFPNLQPFSRTFRRLSNTRAVSIVVLCVAHKHGLVKARDPV